MTCDCDTNKVTAIGEVDALKLKEKVERKMKRPVQLISPLPKAGNKEKKPNENDSKGNKGDDKKTKVKEVMLLAAYSLLNILHTSVYVVFTLFLFSSSFCL